MVDGTVIGEAARGSPASVESGELVVFGPPERSIVGFYHSPSLSQNSGAPGTSGTTARTLAVVLCNPLGYEAMSAHRTYRHLASRLAARGFPALRFDYDGTGDSAGRLDDPGRVRAWIESIKAAVDEARARSGARQVGLFGVRFGATLAMAAATELGEVECVALWAPIVSGRMHVRELRAFRMMKSAKSAAPAPPDGGEEVGGYLFGRETLNDMSALDLLTPGTPQTNGHAAAPSSAIKRVLVLSRGERPGSDETRFVEGWKTRGAHAELLPELGYARMMRDDPYESVVPTAGLDAIVDWLAHGRYAARVAPAQARVATHPTLTVRARDGRTTLTETPLLFGPGKRLAGVLTEPEAPAEGDRPALVFLNVGGNHHVGPHRMNVELARELAALGYLTFRFDVAGLGDSPAVPGTRENRIYTKDSIADVKSAMALMGEMRRTSRFVLVGLCSGSYLVYHTAIDDARVVGQVLLSPYAFEWKEGDSVAPKPRKTFRSTRFYARALFDHRVWLRALRGDVELRGIAGVLLERIMTQIDSGLPSLSASLQGKRRPKNEVESNFGMMSDRGVETLVVLSFDDGGVDMISQYLGTDARKMRGRKNFEFEIMEGVDHTFQSIASQRLLRERLARFVTARFP